MQALARRFAFVQPAAALLGGRGVRAERKTRGGRGGGLLISKCLSALGAAIRNGEQGDWKT